MSGAYERVYFDGDTGDTKYPWKDCTVLTAPAHNLSYIHVLSTTDVQEIANALREMPDNAVPMHISAVNSLKPRMRDSASSTVTALSRLLSSAVVCCSALAPADKKVVQLCCKTLGGVYSANLNHECTHLILGRTGTNKHVAAMDISHVQIVVLDWILDSFVDGFRAHEEGFPVPAFYNCRVCVTGLDWNKRKEVETYVTDHGGEYVKNLTSDCTHLVANAPEGNKYEFAVANSIPVVSLDWVNEKKNSYGAVDDIQYSLGDETYHKVVEMTEKHKNSSVMFDLIRFVDGMNPSVPFRLEDTFSGCVVSILGLQDEYSGYISRLVMYGGGIALRFFHPEQTTHAVTSSEYLKREKIPPSVLIVTPEWILESFKSGQIRQCLEFAVQLSEPLTNTPTLSYKSVTPSQGSQSKVLSRSKPPTNFSTFKYTPESEQGFTSFEKLGNLFFSGKTFMIDHFSIGQGERVKCEGEIVSFGGVVADPTKNGYAFQDDPFVCISQRIPEGQSVKLFENLETEFSKDASCHSEFYCTPRWLFSCSATKKILQPTSSIEYLVFPSPVKVPAFKSQKVQISVSQFVGSERDRLGKLVRASGAKYSDRLSKSTTHLIYNSLSKFDVCSNPKYTKAIEWGIPVVHYSWFYDCIATTTLLPTAVYEKYLTSSVVQMTPSKSPRSLQLSEALDAVLDKHNPAPQVSLPGLLSPPVSRLHFDESQSESQISRHKSNPPREIIALDLQKKPQLQEHRSFQDNSLLVSTSSLSKMLLQETPSELEHGSDTANDSAPIDFNFSFSTIDASGQRSPSHPGNSQVSHKLSWDQHIVYLTRKTRKDNPTDVAALEATGVSFAKSLNKSVTVFVMDGNLTKSKEGQTALARAKLGELSIVGSEWISECVDAGRFVSFEGFIRAQTTPGSEVSRKRKASGNPSLTPKKMHMSNSTWNRHVDAASGMRIQQSDMEHFSGTGESDSENCSQVYYSKKPNALTH